MGDHLQDALGYAHQNQHNFLEQLKEFTAIPSVSTEPEYHPDIDRAADWVASQLRKLGLEGVQVLSTGGHPVVYAESLNAGQQAPTVLIYGHYDVQPAEPLDAWGTHPFEPTVKDNKLYGRGASDMKGQVMACINSLEAICRTGELPVNVKFLIEGEEEIGSPNLGEFILQNRDLLRADFALNPDTGAVSADHPTITYGLRGLAYFELRVYGPEHDLHSGLYGGAVHNPAQALCELIAGMHDEQGRVTLPGFYDRVRVLDESERRELSRLPMDERFYLEQTGVPQLWGEAGYSPVERTGARPTLEVNGLYSGYTGPGQKTVLPAQAMAKISMRLVPDQDPDEVQQQLIRYLEANAPPTIHWQVISLAGSSASISDRNSLAVKALDKAFQTVWGTPAVFKREGGSVPVVSQFQDYLNIETVNTGFGLPGDGVHGPNESLDLHTWYQGIDALVHFFFNLKEL